jgi:protein O-GlcNAc transferase
MNSPLEESYIPTLNQLASQALTNRMPDRAIPLLQLVLQSDPNNFPALSNMGTAHKLKGQYKLALPLYRHAVKIQPKNPEIQFNLGQLYLKTGQFKLALKHLLLSIKYGGEYTGLHFNTAVCYEETNNGAKAQSMYEAIIAQDINYLPALSNLAKLYQNTWQWDKLHQISPKLNHHIIQKLKANQPVFEKPYTNLLRSDDKSFNLAVAKNHSDFLQTNIQKVYPHQSPGTNHQALKIGYLSCDFGDHVMAYHTHSIFKFHNRHQFKIHTYAYGPKNQSPYRQLIQKHSYVWRDVSNKSAATIAEKIHNDHIDILIDLSGHTGNSRFEIMAYRPAPIQAHYLGFPGSTGANFIDYLFTDKVLTPPEYQPYFTENLIYLPDCYQINPHEKIHPGRYTRKQFRLPEKGIIFCSFNQSRKITPEIFSIWLKLLKHVPNSVLWLVKSNDIATKNMQRFAQTQGINPNRLIFASFIEFDQQLDRLSLADIALDPILYNGGATTSDALLAGIPVITKTGTRYVSRMSTSILTCLGLTECITHTNNEYYRVAHDLATHPQKLTSLKSLIIKRKSSSPLFDTKRFVNNIESAYQTMWQRYIQGKPPQTFSVKNAS